MVFEYLGQAIMSLDLLGMGAYLTMQSLSLGLALLISKGEKETLLITCLFLNLTFGLLLFYLLHQASYFILTAIVIVIILMIPENIFQYYKNAK